MEQVEAEVRVALSKVGFGVLTEIYMAATLREKLGVDRRAMRVLGACNPNFVHQALEMSTSVALSVPCNIVLQEVDGGITVSALDPTAIMSTADKNELGMQARSLLADAIASLEGVSPSTNS